MTDPTTPESPDESRSAGEWLTMTPEQAEFYLSCSDKLEARSIGDCWNAIDALAEEVEAWRRGLYHELMLRLSQYSALQTALYEALVAERERDHVLEEMDRLERKVGALKQREGEANDE